MNTFNQSTCLKEKNILLSKQNVYMQVTIFNHILMYPIKLHESIQKRYKLCIIWKLYIQRLLFCLLDFPAIM